MSSLPMTMLWSLCFIAVAWRRVRRRVAASAAVLALLAGCAGADPLGDGAGAHAPPSFLFGTTWFVEQIDDAGPADGAIPVLTFPAADRVAGAGGCNSFAGPVTIDGDTMTFGVPATTDKVCAPAIIAAERRLLAAIAGTRSYQIRGPWLMLADGSGTVRAKLIAKVR